MKYYHVRYSYWSKGGSGRGETAFKVEEGSSLSLKYVRQCKKDLHGGEDTIVIIDGWQEMTEAEYLLSDLLPQENT